MKYFLRFLIFVSLILFTFQNLKALHPAFQAPLHDHMVEVNKEWLHQAEAKGELALPVSFDNDRDRIQTHLFWVIDILRDRTDELALSASQRLNRLAMLNTLEGYAEAGTFPKNTGHRYRIPYFIDMYGTPCAVGHLLIESGFEEVAQRVKEEMNNAYVREIPYEELPQWAETYGFLVSELAWIQPGYPPANKWSPVGGSGANAPGNVILEDTVNGGIVVFGAFTDFNGVPCYGAVRVNGMGTTALDTLALGGVETAVMYLGDIWVGGMFKDTQGIDRNLAKWDGTQWEFSNVGYGPVHCLHVFDGRLYAGGVFPSAIFDNLAVYENGFWAPVAFYIGPIYAMATFQNKLIIGGDFKPNAIVNSSYIASWDGTHWQALETGMDTLNAPVKVLHVDGNKIYAGGEIVNNNGDNYFGLASLEDPALGWQYMLPTYNSFIYFPGMDSSSAYINSIQTHEGKVYLGGSFFASSLLIQGTNCGIHDTVLGGIIDPIGVFSSPLSDMTWVGNKVYATGEFVFPSGYVVETSVSTGIPDDPRFEELIIYPNPANQAVTFQWDMPTQGMNLVLDIYDISGRKIEVEYEVNSQSIRLLRGNLPAGAYAFVLRDGEQPLNRGRFIFR